VRRREVALGRLAAATMLLMVLAATPPATAQAPARPSVTQARITVSFTDGGEDTVEATFTVQNTAALADGQVEHLLVRRPGATIGDVNTSGAASGAPQVTPGQGLTRYRVVVTGDPATYTLRYSVRRDAGAFAVPVLAPNLPVARSERLVTIESWLPPGQLLAGEYFPSIDHREEREGRQVLVHRIVNVPAVVIAEYGTSRRFSASAWVTLIGFVLFGAVLGGWYRHILKRR
jgi:hypothetical protein